MNYNIKTYKDRDGWNAKTTVDLGQTPEGQRMLELVTRKVSGGLSAYASVFYQKEPENGFYIKTTTIFEDFFKSGIAKMPVKRVTEKTVIQAHQQALSHMDSLIEEVKVFYQKKDQLAT